MYNLSSSFQKKAEKTHCLSWLGNLQNGLLRGKNVKHFWEIVNSLKDNQFTT